MLFILLDKKIKKEKEMKILGQGNFHKKRAAQYIQQFDKEYYFKSEK